MTAVEWWCLAAAIVAGLGGLVHLAAARDARPAELAATGRALTAWAVGLLAVAIAVSVL